MTPEQKWMNHVAPTGPTAASVKDLAMRNVRSAAEHFRHHVGPHKFKQLLESGYVRRYLILKRRFNWRLVAEFIRDYDDYWDL